MLEQHEYSEFDILYRQLTRRLSLEWNKQSAQALTGSHAYILEKLLCEGPQKVSSLAEAIGITAGAVTGLADKLIGYGYATRARCSEDRRVVRLEITPKGEATLKEYYEKRTHIRNLYFKDLPDEDIRHLVRIFKQVLNNHEQRNKETGEA